jgi:hypothetical protein
MSTGYSGTPLVKKLGVKDGSKVTFINPPENYFSLLGELPLVERTDFVTGDELDFVHVFSKTQEELFVILNEMKSKIKKTGMIWVSWPKKASRVQTDLTEDVIRAQALKIDLVDIKVCAIDEIWSGLKLVIPLNKR